MKAIHNTSRANWWSYDVVTDIKDTSFWKQFTTANSLIAPKYKLLLISKIPHFESNSQLYVDKLDQEGCCYWYQRYLILKAIHNPKRSQKTKIEVVTDIKDTSFWKQFTTQPSRCIYSLGCYWYQRYLILKAIHNAIRFYVLIFNVVTDIKDTSFWKQFTTQTLVENLDYRLLLISKIPHFESNSQQKLKDETFPASCYWYQRYLILKAIHNRKQLGLFCRPVVTDIKDTSFWKQFTTKIYWIIN